jgi:hypothetical protein
MPLIRSLPRKIIHKIPVRVITKIVRHEIPTIAVPIEELGKLTYEINLIRQKNDEQRIKLSSEINDKLSALESACSSALQNIIKQQDKINEETEEYIKSSITNLEQSFTDKLLKVARLIPTKEVIAQVISENDKSEPFDADDFEKKLLSKIPPPKKDFTDDEFIGMFEKLANKKKIKTEHINGLQQTLDAFRHQLSMGYLHGGGLGKLVRPILTTTNNFTFSFSTPLLASELAIYRGGGRIFSEDGDFTTTALTHDPTKIQSITLTFILETGETLRAEGRT